MTTVPARRPASRLAAAATLAAAGLAALAGCVRTEIRPVDPAVAPSVVATPVLEPSAPARPGDWTVLRVAGEPPAPLTETPGLTAAGDAATFYAAGPARLSAALPEGWPPPTAPGTIELKRYPVTRQAVVETGRGEGSAFWPLFRHISSRDIAMTAPVVMTGEMAGEREGGASMAFLYRTRELGPVGPAERGVRVEDTAPETVIAIGMRGSRSRERLLDARAALQAWLDEQPAGDRWMRAGEPRLLGYNGPDAARDRRWWEVQLPVRWTPATDAPTAETGEAEAAPSAPPAAEDS